MPACWGIPFKCLNKFLEVYNGLVRFFLRKNRRGVRFPSYEVSSAVSNWNRTLRLRSLFGIKCVTKQNLISFSSCPVRAHSVGYEVDVYFQQKNTLKVDFISPVVGIMVRRNVFVLSWNYTFKWQIARESSICFQVAGQNESFPFHKVRRKLEWKFEFVCRLPQLG